MDKRSFLATNKCSSSVAEFDFKIKSCIQNILPKQSVFFGLFDGNFEPFDGQRIFGTNIYQSFVGSNAVTADGHGFEHRVRITFEDRAIHESSRVALIGITNHVFFIRNAIVGNFPFQSGRETAASTSAQTRFFYYVNGFGRRHFRQYFSQSHIGIVSYGFVDIFRIYKSAVAQRNAQLFFIKSHVFGVGNVLFIFRIYVEQPFYLPSLDDMFVNNFPGIFGLYFHVECIVGQHIDNRSFFAKTETSGADYLYLVAQSFHEQFVLQIIMNDRTAGRLTTCAATKQNMHFVFRHL